MITHVYDFISEIAHYLSPLFGLWSHLFVNSSFEQVQAIVLTLVAIGTLAINFYGICIIFPKIHAEHVNSIGRIKIEETIKIYGFLFSEARKCFSGLDTLLFQIEILSNKILLNIDANLDFEGNAAKTEDQKLQVIRLYFHKIAKWENKNHTYDSEIRSTIWSTKEQLDNGHRLFLSYESILSEFQQSWKDLADKVEEIIVLLFEIQSAMDTKEKIALERFVIAQNIKPAEMGMDDILAVTPYVSDVIATFPRDLILTKSKSLSEISESARSIASKLSLQILSDIQDKTVVPIPK